MASNAPCTKSTLKEGQRMRKFYKETFKRVLEIYGLRPESFNNVLLPGYKHSTPAIISAIVVFSYMCRPRFRSFKSHVRATVNEKYFHKVAMALKVQRDENYFFNFLVWIAYVFDFAVFCFIDGMDYFKLATHCLCTYPDIDYFHSKGGWGKLHEQCKPFPELWDTLLPFIQAEDPHRKTVYPIFNFVHESINSSYGYYDWFWSNNSGTFILNLCRNLMKEHDLDLDTSSLSVRIEKRSLKSIPRTPLLSPQQASSQTSSEEGLESTSSQSNTRMWEPLTLNPISGIAERFPDVEQLSEDSVKTPAKNWLDTLKSLSIHAANALAVIEDNLDIEGATASLTFDDESLSSGDVFFQLDEGYSKVVSDETKELCEALIKNRVENEIKAGVSWKKLCAEPRDQTKCSEPKSGVQAELVSSSETVDAYQRVETSKQSTHQKKKRSRRSKSKK